MTLFIWTSKRPAATVRDRPWPSRPAQGQGLRQPMPPGCGRSAHGASWRAVTAAGTRDVARPSPAHRQRNFDEICGKAIHGARPTRHYTGI